MSELNPDFDRVLERFDYWWRTEIFDRPLVGISWPRPPSERRPDPPSRHACLRDRWLDTGYQVELAEARLANTVYFADSLPIAWPDLGPEWFAALYGCPIEFGDDTAWTSPLLDSLDSEEADRLQIRYDGELFRTVIELSDALVDSAQGRYIIGYTDLHGGADALASLRGPQGLLLDTLECPDRLKALCRRITDDFLDVYDALHRRLAAAGMPSTTWVPALSPGKMHVPGCDFSCMISGPAFEDHFLPDLFRECAHMDHCLYHLDGPLALRHLDLLLDCVDIHAVQWAPGARQQDWKQWIEVYRRIQSAGKALPIIEVPVEDLNLLFSTLKPEGVWVQQVSGVNDRLTAERVVQAFSRWA